ncbi:serine threonine-protein kinase aurora-1-like [Stylonychia lemnae]|uniref:Aurora kinase n=1 Tax=Stylonychia lemnae TaxID=5949 RepID=A0A078B8Y8_STYLE|nr:serine threonine-protein kinase aurora-1-like [Stylonychia lemnae]|eukprot:CDW90701.1 serine threonine-protein kinase aurora-1-like [Stylonychia lemnae]
MISTASHGGAQTDSHLENYQMKQQNYQNQQTQRKEAWTIEDFKNVQSIGNGKFGKVFKALERNSNKQVAIKMVHKNLLEKFDFFTQMKKELEIQWRLRHPNIIRLFGYFYDDKSIYVVLEYAQYGNLYQKLKKEKFFKEDRAKNIIRQIVDALIYMQERNVIHRDIKPENILIMDIDKMHVKLCDYGWSTHTIDERRMTFCGTVDYVAPELIYQEPYDEKIDVWAVGILTYELLTGTAPFTGQNEKDTYQNITNLDLQANQIYEKISYEAKDFIGQILVNIPSKRMQLEDMLRHPWLNENSYFGDYN